MPLGVILGIVKAATPYLAAASAVQGIKTARDQRKQQRREAAIQAEAHARAERQKAHNDRELAWRRSKGGMRRRSGYGYGVSGYPTGYDGF